MSTATPLNSPNVEFIYHFDAEADPEGAEKQLLGFEQFLTEHGIDLGDLDRFDPDDDLSDRGLIAPLLGSVTLLENLLHAGFEPASVCMASPEIYSEPECIEEARAMVELLKAAEIPLQPATAIDAVLERFADRAASYRAGNMTQFGVLFGQSMAGTAGRVGVRLVNEELLRRLAS